MNAWIEASKNLTFQIAMMNLYFPAACNFLTWTAYICLLVYPKLKLLILYQKMRPLILFHCGYVGLFDNFDYLQSYETKPPMVAYGLLQDRKTSWTELNELNWTNWTEALCPMHRTELNELVVDNIGRRTELNELLFLNDFELNLRHHDITPHPRQASKPSQKSTPSLHPGDKSGPAIWDFR